MAVINARRAVGGDSYSDNAKQVVRLERGTYGMMLARYTLPKLVQKYQSSEQEEKMFLSFVVTHDRTNAQLPHFSEAFVGVRPTLFYSEGKMSNYVAVLFALLGGKVPHEQIAPQEGVEPIEVDWDELIGKPCLGFIEPASKPGKNGLFSNIVKSLEPPDSGLKKAILPLWQQRKEGTDSKGLVHLTFPATAYQDDANAAPATPAHDDLDGEIPF